MGVANRMNRGGKFAFKFDESKKDEIKYLSPEDLFNSEEKFVVKLMFINKHGNYGDQPAFANEEAILNCPKHMLDDVKEFMNDDEIIAQCDAGKLAVEAYKYDTKNDKRGYSYGLRWIDLD